MLWTLYQQSTEHVASLKVGYIKLNPNPRLIASSRDSGVRVDVSLLCMSFGCRGEAACKLQTTRESRKTMGDILDAEESIKHGGVYLDTRKVDGRMDKQSNLLQQPYFCPS